MRQISIAVITRRWVRFTWPALAVRQASPWRRKISASSSFGRSMFDPRFASAFLGDRPGRPELRGRPHPPGLRKKSCRPPPSPSAPTRRPKTFARRRRPSRRRQPEPPPSRRSRRHRPPKPPTRTATAAPGMVPVPAAGGCRGWGRGRCRRPGAVPGMGPRAGDRDHAATRFRAARAPRAPSTRALTQKAFLPGLGPISRPRGTDRAAPSYGVVRNHQAFVKRAADPRRPLPLRPADPKHSPAAGDQAAAASPSRPRAAGPPGTAARARPLEKPPGL